MFKRLIKRFVTAKEENRTEDSVQAALEKEVAELKALVEKQANQAGKEKIQRTVMPQTNASSTQVQCRPTEKASYFDMVEYFCNGHNDTAVDVIQYDSNGNVIMKKTFSWSDGCGEVTSEGIWEKADTYAQGLISDGILCRNKKPIGAAVNDRNLKQQVENPTKEGTENTTILVNEIKDYETVMQQPVGTFFPIGGAVLVESLGSWEKDVEEAQRRMDLFFSTAEAYKFARKRDTAAECKGSFHTIGNYGYTFWSREYFHSHDGWDTEGESATIIRISPKEFYHPSDPYHAKERVLAMCGGQNTRVRLNGWGDTSYEQLWNVPEGLEALEQERYYLGYSKFRAKNFLGMVGCFEVRWSSF